MNIQAAEKEKGMPSGVKKDSHPFDIGDHIERILDMMGLHSCDDVDDKKQSPLSQLLKRMTEPPILDALPFSNQVLDDDDKSTLDDTHHKMVIIIGRGGNGIGPDDIDEIRDIATNIDEKLAVMRAINTRMASREEPVVESAVDASKSLADAFYLALRCADISTAGEPSVDAVASMIRSCNHAANHEVNLEDDDREVLSGIVSDLSSYIPTQGFFKNIASRLKYAYQRVRADNDESMEKQAFVVLRNPAEDFTGRQGYNICPKFKSHMSSKAAVPVEHSYCRDYCVEGRPEPDGTVTCKYAEWLSTIDSHEKAMARYPEEKNPANADMALRLPDGKRSQPRKENAVGIEERMQRGSLNDTKRDTTKNMERLIEDLISESGAPGRQYDIDNQSNNSIERQLRAALGPEKPIDKTAEPRLGDKRDDSAHGVGPDNAMESRLRDVSPDKKFDHTKLLDELLEDEYPRTESKLPRRD